MLVARPWRLAPLHDAATANAVKQAMRDHLPLQEQIDSGSSPPRGAGEEAPRALKNLAHPGAWRSIPRSSLKRHEYPDEAADTYPALARRSRADMCRGRSTSAFLTLQALGGNLKLAAAQMPVRWANDNGGLRQRSRKSTGPGPKDGTPALKGMMGKVFGVITKQPPRRAGCGERWMTGMDVAGAQGNPRICRRAHHYAGYLSCTPTSRSTDLAQQSLPQHAVNVPPASTTALEDLGSTVLAWGRSAPRKGSISPGDQPSSGLASGA